MSQTKENVMVQNEAGDPYQAPGYARSRWAYIAECGFEYFIALLVTTPFLPTLLKYMGFNDATTGIIQSLISVAFLFQLCSVFVVQRITNVKRFAAIVHGIGQLFFTFLYVVPFLPFPQEIAQQYRAILVFACFLIGYFGNYLVTSIIFRWGNSFVDPKKRARYAATKEMISLLTGVIVTLSLSSLFDYYEGQASSPNDPILLNAFLIAAIAMAVICAVDFLMLMLMKNRISEPPKKGETVPFFQVLKLLFSNKSFVYVVILATLWQCSHYMLLGFMGTYQQYDLGIDVLHITWIAVAGQMGRFALSRPFGRYTDKRSYAKGLTLGISIAAVGYFVNIFTSPSIWWMVIVFVILNNVAMAGISQNLFNIVYNFVDEKYFVQASAIKNSISGACGFGAALIGGWILNTVQMNGNVFFGVQIYGQQILSLIAFVIAVIAIFFTRFVLQKQKIIAK